MKISNNWKPIEGFEGSYSVNDTGQVYSHKSHKVMCTYYNNNGYEMIKFNSCGNNGHQKHFLIHRLVAKAFCEGYTGGLVVNHIDGNRQNNVATNLEWCTTLENVHDMMERGTHNYTEAHKAARIARRIKVNCIDEKTGDVVNTFNSLEDAKEWLGVSSTSHISTALNGKRPRAYGYKWERAKKAA